MDVSYVCNLSLFNMGDLFDERSFSYCRQCICVLRFAHLKRNVKLPNVIFIMFDPSVIIIMFDPMFGSLRSIYDRVHIVYYLIIIPS